MKPRNDAVKHIRVGAIWRRRKTGALLRITGVVNHASHWNQTPYYDISWATVEKPVRRGQSYEDYWLKNCEPVPGADGAVS